MPTFIPLTKPRPLPTIGQAIERPVMDWKARPSPHAFEKAKDVAAFANHLGGTLLIGAQEQNGQLSGYAWMSPAEAAKVRDDYSKAVADRCQPHPAIDFEEYQETNDPNKRVVAINVQPSLNLVGVRVKADKANEGFGRDVYAFPVRSGTDADYLEPGQLAMFMTPQIRRVAVMLSRIPLGAPVRLSRVDVPGGSHSDLQFLEVAEEENLAKFRTSGGTDAYIPLDRIESAYRNGGGQWMVLAVQWA
jgi:hypothetical protein